MNSAVASIVDAVSGGYSTDMTCNYFLEEMSGWDTDDEEYASVKFLRKNMVMEGKSMTGQMRPWLDRNKWSELLGDPKNWPEFEATLRALGNYDIGLEDAISESGLCEEDLDTEEAKELFREFRDADKDYHGIDGLIRAAQNLQEDASTNRRKRPRSEEATSP